jgi:hypothetical protein
MTLPVGNNYLKATVSNPTTSLTDFPLLISIDSTYTDYWTAVDTTDGTRARFAKDSGAVEVPFDVLYFDDIAELAVFRVKWSGTLSNVGVQELRAYPPTTSSTPYAVTDPFGGHNAYRSEIKAFYPLTEDIQNRTSTSIVSTAGDLGPVIEAAAGGNIAEDYGQIGNFDTNFRGRVNTDYVPTVDTDLTVMAYVKPVAIRASVFQPIIGTSSNSVPLVLGWVGTEPVFRVGANAQSSTSVVDGQEHFLAGRLNLTTDEQILYVDGVQEGSFVQTGGLDTSGNTLQIGGDNNGLNYFDAIGGQVFYIEADLGVDWVKTEYDQASNNATFWGTWAWQGGDVPPAFDTPGYDNLASYNWGTSPTFTPQILSGTLPFTYSVTAGSLGSGRSLDVNSGNITGTFDTVGSVSYTITATNTGGNDSAIVSFDVDAIAPVFDTPAYILSDRYALGAVLNETPALTQDAPNIVYSVTAGSLPTGITVNASTGVLEGTISALATLQTYNATITADNTATHPVDGGTSNTAISFEVIEQAETFGWNTTSWNSVPWNGGDASLISPVDPFIFTAVVDASTSTVYTSNTITPTGEAGTYTINIVGGEYSIDGGAFTSASGNFTVGSTIAVRQTSSASFNTETLVSLDIGGRVGLYSVTTQVDAGTIIPVIINSLLIQGII